MLKRTASSGGTVDLTSIVRDAVRAITNITTDDLVRYAHAVVAAPDQEDSGEMLLALGVIWLWGRSTDAKDQGSAAEDWTEREVWPSDPRLRLPHLLLVRWFAGLSRSAQISVLSAYASVLSASPGELKVLGAWSPPDAISTHMPFVLSLFIVLFTHAAVRYE